MARVRFYFDYISTNAYLAWLQMPTIAHRHGFVLEPVPVLFAGLLEAHGTTGPAEIPAKSLWMFKNNLRKAALSGVPLNPPAFHPFNPLLSLRVTSLARDVDECDALITRLFEAVWVRGEHVSEPEVVERAARDVGLDGAALVVAASEAEAKARLRAQTDDAIARGVFGVPSMEVNGELFWGYDDLPYLELCMAGEDPLARTAWGKTSMTAPRPSAMRRAHRDRVERGALGSEPRRPMRQVVLVKQVPAVSALAFDPETRTLKREGVRLEVSSFDVRALLRAVELRAEVGGEVVALTMGPPAAREALAYCLALGADRGIHLSDRAFAGADTLATARALAAALAREPFDLVLCGRASVDAETAQVGPQVAELLDLPQVCCARTLTLDAAARTFTAERETDEGSEVVTGPLPALVTAGEDLAAEKFPRRADKEAAKAKPIVTLAAADLGIDVATVGAAGSPTWVEGLQTVSVARPGRIIDGELDAAIDTLVAELVRRGLFAPAGVAAPEGHASTSRERSPSPSTPGTSAAVSAPVIEPTRAGDFWVVAELFDGTVRRVTLELLATARRLSAAARIEDESGGGVAVVLVGADVARHVDLLARHGADRVLLADDPRLARYATEPYAALLARAIAAGRPRAVLLPSTYVGRDLAPRVAGRLGLGLTGDCIELTLGTAGRLVQWKPAFGGNVVAPILSRTQPEMATVRPGVLPVGTPRPDAVATVEALALADLPTSRVQARETRRDPSAAHAAALDEAEIAIGVGLGIGGPDALPAIGDLATALGGAPIATTRDVVDKGWLARQHQVGITGRAIAPRFYFAIGIRGAAEHMVGVRRAGTIVVIDKNPQAPIFAQADLGIVADWADAVPRLARAFARARERSE